MTAQRKFWVLWALLTLSLLSALGYVIFSSQAKENLIIGDATHGHHQIEMACDTCHSDPFGGPEVLQNACTNCHLEELENAHDSHPRKKFTNPRNAELATRLDAKQCITCHTEHQLEQTRAMGVTVPNDVCFHCHQDVGKNRDSHKDLPFDTCATSGCHNFHDNRALYEDFLIKNSGKPWVNYQARLTARNSAKYTAKKGSDALNETLTPKHPEITAAWSLSAHQTSDVSCLTCHESPNDGDGDNNWVEKPSIDVCGDCHAAEFTGFVSGKHGMRLSPKIETELPPMSPGDARIDVHPNAHAKQLSCASCHDVHQPNLKQAAMESCLGCHSDQHSLAYKGSPHATLFDNEVNGVGEPNSGVSCASCHMPREQQNTYINLDPDTRQKEVRVQHNQNATLRPNEKMIRPVCLQCHSLEFSIDALADESLILNNFNGKPSQHVESVDWALRRENR